MVNLSDFIRPMIILFGDSITEQGYGLNGSIGWVSLLSSIYSRRADVFNRGYSGYTTKHGAELLPKVYNSAGQNNNNEVLFTTIFFGANDASMPGEPQHIPIEEYTENLIEMITYIRENLDGKNEETCTDDQNNTKNNTKPIILITPPPVDEAMWADARKVYSSDRQNNVTRQYGLKIKEIKETKYSNDDHLLVLDSWEVLGGKEGSISYSKYLSDGLHLNDLGNQELFFGLMKLIQKQIPHVAPKLEQPGISDDYNLKYGTSNGTPLEEKLWTELYL